MKLVDCSVRAKNINRLSFESKSKTNNTVTIIKNGTGAVINGSKTAGDFEVDAVCDIKLFSKHSDAQMNMARMKKLRTNNR